MQSSESKNDKESVGIHSPGHDPVLHLKRRKVEALDSQLTPVDSVASVCCLSQSEHAGHSPLQSDHSNVLERRHFSNPVSATSNTVDNMAGSVPKTCSIKKVELEDNMEDEVTVTDETVTFPKLVSMPLDTKRLESSGEIRDDPGKQPEEGRCHLFISKKKRYCRAAPPAGQQYCVEHSHLIGNGSNRKRIQCPLDSKHTCYEDHLPRHLKRCNAKEGERPDYYVKEINCGSSEGEDPKQYKVSIRDITDEEVLELVVNVKKLHKAHVPELPLQRLFHEVLRKESENPQNGCHAQKHIQQQASLVSHIERLGLLQEGCTFVEFGAGKGGLSHWVQLALKDGQDTNYILVERGAVRYKMDNFHKGVDQGPSFERLRVDIQHLHLGNVQSLKDSGHNIVGIGKHLCGAATDLMLRCLMETTKTTTNDEHPRKYGVEGVVLAVCCHHRCDWQSYVGKHFFRDCGLTARDFHLITTMSSWGTCGTRPVKLDKKDDWGTQDHTDMPSNDATEYNHPRYGHLLPEEREEIGRQCKQLIDMGRVQYLAQRGFDAQLVCYIEKDFSLENMAIIARQRT